MHNLKYTINLNYFLVNKHKIAIDKNNKSQDYDKALHKDIQAERNSPI